MGAGRRGWALDTVVSLLVKGRTLTSLSYWVCVVAGSSSVFRWSCLFDFGRPGSNVTDI